MLRLCLAIGLALLCPFVFAKQPPLPLPVAQELPVEIVLDQMELAIDVPPTAAQMGAQFGLIGAMIGSGIQNSQTKRAEEAVIPLRNQLLDYPFSQHLEAAVRLRLASEGISPNPHVTMMKTPWDVLDPERDADGMPPRAMVIRPRFAVDNGFSRLSVLLQVTIEDRVVRSNGKVKSKYAFNRNYAFQSTLPLPADQSPEIWAALGGERLAALLDQGIEQAVDMVVYDFSAEGRAQWAGKYNKARTQLNGNQYIGQEQRRSDQWVWVRTGNKVIQALDGFQPLSLDSAGASPGQSALAEANAIDGAPSTNDDAGLALESDAASVPHTGSSDDAGPRQ